MEPLPSKSPPRGSVPIKAVVFDTFGTVCDFYSAFKRGFTQLAEARGLDCDPGELAIAWRTAYLVATVSQAFTSSTFRPLSDINRDNLLQLVGERYDIELTEKETHDMVTLWRTKPLALATRSSSGSGLSIGRMVRIIKALRPCCEPTAIR